MQQRALLVPALLALCLAPSCYILGTRDWSLQYEGAVLLALTGVGFCLSMFLLNKIAVFHLKKGISGKDMAKPSRPVIPEAMGLTSGIVYLMVVIGVQYLVGVPHGLVGMFNAALMASCFILLLGFADDVLDLPWRYKLVLPAIASLPLLATYTGPTTVLIPSPLRQLLMSTSHAGSGTNELTVLGSLVNVFATVDENAHGAIVDLGYFFLLYMCLLAVFCTNTINIYAGVNGLESGQTVVIACAVLFTNLLEVSRAETPYQHPHFFSLCLIVPFLGATLPLMYKNWCPSQLFVGDTFCYSSGMVLAVAAILGHYSKTLLLLLVPQIFNFLYSTPQLFKLYPCPRHRLPWFNEEDGLLHPSTFEVKKVVNGETVMVRRANMTLINLVLQVFGPMKEGTLTTVLLLIQALSCTLGILIRYYFADLIFGTH